MGDSQELNFPLYLYRAGLVLGKGTFAEVCLFKLDRRLNFFKVRKRLADYSNENGVSEETKVRKHVVVKTVFLQSGDNADPAMASLMSERRTQNLLLLRHPNLLQLYGSKLSSDADEESLTLVMEMCQGNLRRLASARRRRGLEEWEMVWIAVQMLRGARFLHSRNIVHRDLKPENVLLKHLVLDKIPEWSSVDVSWLQVKIADFGFPRCVPSKEGHYLNGFGTPGYVAPEMAPGVQFTKEADMFSAGVILFELRHKRIPNSRDIDQEPKESVGAIDCLLQFTLQTDPTRRLLAGELLSQVVVRETIEDYEMPPDDFLANDAVQAINPQVGHEDSVDAPPNGQVEEDEDAEQNGEDVGDIEPPQHPAESEELRQEDLEESSENDSNSDNRGSYTFDNEEAILNRRDRFSDGDEDFRGDSRSTLSPPLEDAPTLSRMEIIGMKGESQSTLVAPLLVSSVSKTSSPVQDFRSMSPPPIQRPVTPPQPMPRRLRPTKSLANLSKIEARSDQPRRDSTSTNSSLRSPEAASPSSSLAGPNVTRLKRAASEKTSRRRTASVSESVQNYVSRGPRELEIIEKGDPSTAVLDEDETLEKKSPSFQDLRRRFEGR